MRASCRVSKKGLMDVAPRLSCKKTAFFFLVCFLRFCVFLGCCWYGSRIVGITVYYVGMNVNDVARSHPLPIWSISEASAAGT